MTIAIGLCCNDDHGNFAGKVDAINVRALDLQLECPMWEGHSCRFDKQSQRVKISRRWFAYQYYREWVGNWAWDEIEMDLAEASRLLNYLRKLGWTWSAGYTEACEMWDSEEDITAEGIEEIVG